MELDVKRQGDSGQTLIYLCTCSDAHRRDDAQVLEGSLNEASSTDSPVHAFGSELSKLANIECSFSGRLAVELQQQITRERRIGAWRRHRRQWWWQGRSW